MRALGLNALLLVAVAAAAQSSSPAVTPAGSSAAPLLWQLQESGSTASLRGIFSVDSKVAWASGTEGTVLRTLDGGEHWTKCTVPDAAGDGATLDFRGVYAWDEKTALVMSSGKGALSRLYQTQDACKTWDLFFANPDKTGFWDAFRVDPDTGAISILGDPVGGAFRLFTQNSATSEMTSKPPTDELSPTRGNPLQAAPGESAFAASNSLFIRTSKDGSFAFVTGGKRSEFIEYIAFIIANHSHYASWHRVRLPFAASESSGAFSVSISTSVRDRRFFPIVVVGGDYKSPNNSSQTAAWSLDGLHFQAAQIPPHGYRSAVQWSEALRAFITVGTNGSDISHDDGNTWQPLDDGEWNALSLPFVVGPKGRIARLVER
jgi:photosystem II stability/assembly factor-like uncharacterized protein